MALRQDLDLNWLKSLANKNNGLCLSAEYRGVGKNYIWECSQGHKFKASAHDIRRGRWCRDCSKFPNRDLSFYNQLALNKGGRCLSSKYENCMKKVQWICSMGHIWNATPNKIQQGKWCPDCGGSKPKNIEYLQFLASKREGKCLAKQYKNMLTLVLWECKFNHTWLAKGNSISNGRWCPFCFPRHSRIETEIYKRFLSVFPDSIQGARILKNKLYEIDIYIPSKNVAIEYDGEYMHSYKNPNYLPERDENKNKMCLEMNIKLFRIKEKDYKLNKNLINNLIKEIKGGDYHS